MYRNCKDCEFNIPRENENRRCVLKALCVGEYFEPKTGQYYTQE
jgi:hypothetical protein